MRSHLAVLCAFKKALIVPVLFSEGHVLETPDLFTIPITQYPQDITHLTIVSCHGAAERFHSEFLRIA